MTEADWARSGWRWMWKANQAKYEQNPDLMAKLKETAGKRLVECNPNDPLWGIALHKDDPSAKRREFWKGRNLFGDLLTYMRKYFDRDDAGKEDLAQVVRDSGHTQ